ncbi:LacI family DNA-binding transcriptional regulator [Pelagicoccus sp. NFK12]|uniref:LacI family DNA-binding transcriptional regulator n=1 Tax=Pelagicoccus enzymogenes TaxID=2773457 RepID=A0A927F9Y2_9BACT|nr:LacI family DNA-binding transcriptional regulator [Pelagicoccus enzymogenes]MBD5780550.1 LacI family DNA-binding transcriptional regulator [Pelagicoccus enzymogenes]
MPPKVSMSTIAAEVGVSKATVSLALRNSPEVSTAMKEKIRETADRLGYQLNPALGQLLSQIRNRDSYRATIALINAHSDNNSLKRHPTIPEYVEGINQRADSLGYRLDYFWLNDPELKARRLKSIMLARGIKGALVVGLMNDCQFPEKLLPIAEALPLVVTGVRTRNPTLPYVCVDHHGLALQAVENALRLGYQRPGLVLDQKIDRLVEGRFSAGYLYGQMRLPEESRLPPLYQNAGEEEDFACFKVWMQEYRPDVIFTLYNDVSHWLQKLGMKAPDDIGLIQLEWRKNAPDWSGMRQHNDHTGEAAVDTLVGMVHRGETGLQAEPRALLIAPSWQSGKTTRKLVEA